MKTLNTKALIVTLNVSQWSARKYDRKVTDEVNQLHNSNDTGRFNKLLIAKDHLSEIGKIVNSIRNFHVENTLPWGDNGERILPCKNYFEYTAAISRHKSSFDACVSKFVREYPAMIDEAKTRLNGMFDDQDYPDDIESKFCVKVTCLPVPGTADFRVELSDNEVEQLRTKINDEVNERWAQASKSIYQRIKDQLEHMHERLSDSSNVFRDRLFENLVDLIKLLPRLNMANDPQIDALCEEMKKLCVDPDAVRNDTLLRAVKADEVRAILNKI
jgi:hypothetical protein